MGLCLQNICQSILLLTLAVLVTKSSYSLDVRRVPFCTSRRIKCSRSRGCALAKPAAFFTEDSGLVVGTNRDEKSFDSTLHAVLCRKRVAPTALALSRGGATEVSSTDTPGASDVLSYYLLWSPGVFRKTFVCFLALLALRLASMPFQDQIAGFASASSPSPFGFIVQVLILPLLSSACCGIQLAINALVGAGGCAGFNKVLGPLRPYFLAVLFVATVSTFPIHHSRAAIVKWTQYSLIRWAVALMPEMVHFWNIHVGERVRQRGIVGDGKAAATSTCTIEMTIPTMGCVACINKIDSSMRHCAPNQIEEAKSWLEPSGKGGRAFVRGLASTQQEAESLAESLVDAVRQAGFESCSVDSIRVEEKLESD